MRPAGLAADEIWRDLPLLSITASSESDPIPRTRGEKTKLHANNTAFIKKMLFLVHSQEYSARELLQYHLSNDLKVSRHFRSQLIAFPLRAPLCEKIKMLFRDNCQIMSYRYDTYHDFDSCWDLQRQWQNKGSQWQQHPIPHRAIQSDSTPGGPPTAISSLLLASNLNLTSTAFSGSALQDQNTKPYVCGSHHTNWN